MIRITNHCRITHKVCNENHQHVLLKDETSTDDWAKQLYKFLQTDYPRFYKMDVLSKFAFIGVELLKQNSDPIAIGLSKYADDDIALLFSNSKSSSDVDAKFQESYQQTNGSPSPALFVYTLPNILIGELSIRNQWFGENVFSIQPSFDAAFFSNYCEILMKQKSKACVCGWVDVTGDLTDVFIFFVEESDNEQMPALSKQNLINLYKQ